MDTHEWLDREKLIDWLDTGQCVHAHYHIFEESLIRRSVEYFVEHHTLNPVAQEVYDHLRMVWDQSELELVYPSLKALRRLQPPDE